MQKRLLLVVVGLGVLMLADTLYLLANRAAGALGIGYFAVTDISLPRFYQSMVLWHTVGGIILVILALAFVEWHLPTVWRRHRRRAIYTGLASVTLGVTLLVTGLFILTEANSRDNAWAWWCHVIAAAALPVFYLAHRRISIWKPSARSYLVVPLATAGLAGLAIVVHGLTYDREAYTEAAVEAFASGTHTGPGSRQRQTGGGPAEFVPANFVPFESPFFPAATTTTTTGSFLPSRIITRGGLPPAGVPGPRDRAAGLRRQREAGGLRLPALPRRGGRPVGGLGPPLRPPSTTPSTRRRSTTCGSAPPPSTPRWRPTSTTSRGSTRSGGDRIWRGARRW